MNSIWSLKNLLLDTPGNLKCCEMESSTKYQKTCLLWQKIEEIFLLEILTDILLGV